MHTVMYSLGQIDVSMSYLAGEGLALLDGQPILSVQGSEKLQS